MHTLRTIYCIYIYICGSSAKCPHSTQRPNSGSTTAGQPRYAIHIAKAAKAVGVDGYFFEVHENPSAAWSDGSNMSFIVYLPIAT